ncbi:MAG TPA: tRNA dihydrouridine synthase DusB [Firmicutes bacterium]|nr:tRNA dihydrouridine synthase DusB [Bacillota bacterium]
MRIGSVALANQVILAPMAGITDLSYRILAREQGCALVYTEMISARGLLYNNKNTREMLPAAGEARPLAVQLFGSEPEVMAEAAKIVAAFPVDIIDINMGCPVAKVVKNGEGAALMQDPERAARIVAAVAGAVSLPVTVKIRKGWDNQTGNAVAFARQMEAAGARAIAVHGRTRSQMYGGRADWQVIREVKESVSIPVIGNGDLWEPTDATRMLVETGCDAVMLARGTLGNPWLISRTVTYLSSGRLPPPPSAAERLTMALRHLDLLITHKGEARGVREMRKFAAWYLKGLPHSAAARDRVTRAKDKDEMRKILLIFFADEVGSQV